MCKTWTTGNRNICTKECNMKASYWMADNVYKPLGKISMWLLCTCCDYYTDSLESHMLNPYNGLSQDPLIHPNTCTPLKCHGDQSSKPHTSHAT